MSRSATSDRGCELGIDFHWSDILFSGRYEQEGSLWKITALAKGLPSFSDVLQKILNTPEPPTLPLLPDFQVEKLGAILSDSGMEFGTSMNLKWSPDLGKEAAKVELAFDKMAFYCKLEKDTPPDCTISLHGCFHIPHAVDIESFDFKFQYIAGIWMCETTVAATILGFTCPSLLARFVHDSSQDKLTLALDFTKPKIRDGLKLINIKGVFCFALEDFSIFITKNRSGKEALEGEGSWEISISSSACLKIEHLRKFKGNLTLTQSSLCFSSADRFDLTVVKTSSLNIGITTAFNRVMLAWGEGNKQFTASLKFKLKKKGIPDFLMNALPNSIDEAGFFLGERNNQTVVEFYARDIQYPDAKPFKIPDIGGVDMSFFNEMKLELNGFGVSLGKSFQTWITLGIGLPDNINHIFGTHKGQSGKQEPNFRLFNTLPNLIRIQFAISFAAGSGENSNLTPGISLRLLDAPFLPDFVKSDGEASQENKTWRFLLGNGGKYGEIRVDSPNLVFADGAFATKAQIKVEQELRIPLAPLHWLICLITGKSRAEIQKFLPDSAPIIMPSLLDNQGRITGTKFVEMLKQYLGSSPLLNSVEKTLNALNDLADRLPKDLKPYLQPKFENGFLGLALDYDISINVTDASFSLAFKIDPPLKFLSFGGSSLVGCTFRSISFGPVLGGSLIKLKLDCDFDQFSLPGLLFDLCLPRNTKVPLSRDFYNRIVLGNVMFLIVYQTEIPIPIPVYFERLKIDYHDILGFAFKAHTYFDKPELSLGGLLNLFSEFLEFIKDKQHRLDLSAAAKKLFPAFYLSNWYMQLPEWMGKEKYLGFKVKEIEDKPLEEQEQFEKDNAFFAIKASDIMQNTCNAIKFFSLAALVEKIPDQYRAGSVDLSANLLFGLKLKAGAEWVMTTPEGFIRHWDQYSMIVDDINSAKHMVTIFPGDIKADTKGVICFIKADVEAGPMAQLHLIQGLVSLSGQKIDGAFELSGTAGYLNSELKGMLKLDHEAMQMVAELSGHITFGGFWPIFTARCNMELQDNEFNAAGEAAIFPYVNFLKVKYGAYAKVNEDKAMVITAATDLKVIGIVLLGGEFRADPGGAKLTGKFLASSIALLLSVTKDGFTYRLDRSILKVLYVSTLEISLSKSQGILKSELTHSFLSSLKYILTYTVSAKVKLSGVFRLTFWNLPVFKGKSSMGLDGYHIDGTYHLFPPGSPLNYSIAMSGDLNSKGLKLYGKNSFTVVVKYTTAVTIDTQRGVQIGTSVKIGRKTISHAKSGITMTPKGVAFWVTYYLWPLHWYFMIGKGFIYGPLPKKPRYWPQETVKTMSFKAEQAPQKPQPPVDAMLILKIMNQIYHQVSQDLIAAEDLEQFGPVMDLYQMHMESEEDKNKDNITNLPLSVTVEIERPEPSRCRGGENLFTAVENGTMKLLLENKDFSKDIRMRRQAREWFRNIDKIKVTGSNGGGIVHSVWLNVKTGLIIAEYNAQQFDDNFIGNACVHFADVLLKSKKE